jgi:hypothetical protein
MPLSMPIDVMPDLHAGQELGRVLQQLERRRCALVAGLSDMAARRALRLEASASSDMANSPLSRVRNAISRKSMQ